jgi:hypothetical protein
MGDVTVLPRSYPDDEHLARQCFRVVRRTCARYHVRIRYYEKHRTTARTQYILQFTGRPHMLGAAARDLFLELRPCRWCKLHGERSTFPLGYWSG